MGTKSSVLDDAEIVRSVNFLPILKIEKTLKKYKIWSPRIFQYEYNVQRFESDVWTFKYEIRTRNTGGFVLHEAP
jgi:hypothetical protein